MMPHVIVSPASLISSWVRVCTLLAALCVASVAIAEPMLIEAEDFETVGDGWRVVRETAAVRSASGVATLWAAQGDVESTAFRSINLDEAGSYRIWVRYRRHPRLIGPFRLSVLRGDAPGGDVLASKVFHERMIRGVDPWTYHWEHFDSELPAGRLTLELATRANRNSSGHVRHVDCVMLTRDLDRKPNHLDFGPRAYLRITLGDRYTQPVYFHLLADTYQRKQREHYAMSRAGVTDRWPRAGDYLRAGQRTPWMDVTEQLATHGGSRWNLAVKSRAGWAEPAPLQATFEFATAPDESAVVRRIVRDEDAAHNTLHLRTPVYTTQGNALAFKLDEDYAQAAGAIADGMTWPTIGRPPQRFPFFVTANVTGGILGRSARAVIEREQATLDYFGFTDSARRIRSGMWGFQNNQCYNQPDIERMRAQVTTMADQYRQEGRDPAAIVYAMLTDEPHGQQAAHLASCATCADVFRQWLRDDLAITPDRLLVDDWSEVRPVGEADREAHPALHYFTQRFRTRALANHMAVQAKLLHEAYGHAMPVNVNISSGNAVFNANFYRQGVDYFEMLGDGRLNALWSSDAVNRASTNQMGSYNAALLRAAAGRHGQHLGMYMIPYDGRKPWDIKAKTISQAGRGIKAFTSFYYGPHYSRNEGTPWILRPEIWFDHAEVVREVGAAEDLLVDAQPVSSPVALIYASSSDIWTNAQRNFAWGFDRMHLWLALTHAQVAVDIISEHDVADGKLNDYSVCYLSGPNLTEAAAGKLAKWVEAGGTLMMTAGAAERDEYDRPLTVLDPLLPAIRGEVQVHQRHESHGQALRLLQAQDTVTAGDRKLGVFSMQQSLSPRGHGQVLGTFDDGSPALVRGAHGRGSIDVAGFLPGLAYIHPALTARHAIEQERHVSRQEADAVLRDADDDAERGDVDEPDGPASAAALQLPPGEVATDHQLLDRSYNPWQFPADVRQMIVEPVRRAAVVLPIECDVPLVDAVLLETADGSRGETGGRSGGNSGGSSGGNSGGVVALANWTLQPQARVELRVRASSPVWRVESVHHGDLAFTGRGTREVRFHLPLRQSDFVMLDYRQATDQTKGDNP